MSASRAAPDTVVLIHGLWLTARSWEGWIERYQRAGYRVLAPSWPGMEAGVEALNADPSPLAALTVERIVDHYEWIGVELERPPIVIGHSFGGTVTEILLDRGLAAAGVAIASATVARVHDLPLSTIKVASPALSPFTTSEPVSLTSKEFHYAFANTLSRETSDALHARYAVPAPGGVLTAHAFSRFQQHGLVDVNREARAPLLFIRFGEDHVVPLAAARSDAETYEGSGSTTEFVEFSGRPHFPGAPGWEEVADYALAWATEHAVRSDGTREEKGDSP
jgi:pimeloyl-ACP methyl ester carboxylesterase